MSTEARPFTYTVPGMEDKDVAELEQFQWFVRAHLENSQGRLSTASATTEKGVARQAG